MLNEEEPTGFSIVQCLLKWPWLQVYYIIKRDFKTFVNPIMKESLWKYRCFVSLLRSISNKIIEFSTEFQTSKFYLEQKKIRIIKPLPNSYVHDYGGPWRIWLFLICNIISHKKIAMHIHVKRNTDSYPWEGHLLSAPQHVCLGVFISFVIFKFLNRHPDSSALCSRTWALLGFNNKVSVEKKWLPTQLRQAWGWGC